MNRISLRVIALVLPIAAAFGPPSRTEAIPVFASGQGVSCQQCHNAPPNLNRYGRYILATNFAKVLSAHAQLKQNQTDPVAIEITGNGSNTATPDTSKTYLGVVDFLSGGYLSKNVTYYASVPAILAGNPASAVDMFWAAYDGLSGGNGSIQVGKIPTPIFAPWISQTLSLTNYGLAALPVGLNTVGIGDNRYGGSYTQIGSNGLIGNVAYLTNTGTIERSFDSNINSTTAGAEGQAVVASVSQMAINSHFTGGLATEYGGFNLPSGATDRYSRTMALASYSTSSSYQVTAMALVGHDNNPNDGASGPSGSNGVSLETIYSATPWLHLDLRYDRTNDGLGTVQNSYVSDVAFSIRPNLVATLENVSSVGQRPVMSYQLLYGGPWLRRKAPAIVAQSDAMPDVDAGKKVFGESCMVCHGAHGQGGIGPSLIGIAERKNFDQAVAWIQNPTPGGVMPKLYPGVISAEQVRDVAAYIRAEFH